MRVVVIGAGMGGLAAAIDLARQGAEVTVVERAAAPGGKMREVTVGGAPIDSGPTVFTLRWVFDRLFEEAGSSLEAELSVDRAGLLARHAWSADERLDLHADIDRSAEAIGDFAGAGGGPGGLPPVSAHPGNREDSTRTPGGAVPWRLSGPTRSKLCCGRGGLGRDRRALPDPKAVSRPCLGRRSAWLFLTAPRGCRQLVRPLCHKQYVARTPFEGAWRPLDLSRMLVAGRRSVMVRGGDAHRDRRAVRDRRAPRRRVRYGALRAEGGTVRCCPR